MQYPVPNEVKQTILGSLLGDGHIRQAQCNGKKTNAHLIIMHGPKQGNYCEWKWELLGPDVRGSFTRTKDGRWRAVTRCHKHMNPFLELIGKPKKVTRKLLNMLDPLGLAIWYQDDGTLGIEYHKRLDGTYGIKRRRIALATDCFSFEEHCIMQQYFKVVWGLDSSIVKVKLDGGARYSHRITFNYENAKKFVEIVKPHIHSSMQYKIDFNRQRNCQNASTPKG